MLLGEPAPSAAEYENGAVTFDPYMAAGNEYDIRQMVTLEADLSTPLEEALVGSANIVVQMSDEVVQEQSAATVAVVLVFTDADMAEPAEGDALVMGRYIGSVEIENDLGGKTPAPAIQVNYMEAL